MSKTKKLSKVLALFLMLALLAGILPMGVAASTSTVYVRFFNGATQIGSTVAVTASDDTAYTAITAAATANNLITSYDITKFAITSINGLNPSNTDENDNDAWLYTVDDKLGTTNIGNMPVSSGSVITVFYTTDYTATQFAYIVPDGAPTSGNAIGASSNETIYYRIATSTVDFQNLYSTIQDTPYPLTVSNETYIEATTTVSGYSIIIPAYKRVVSSSGLLTDWLSATRTAYGALMQAQKNAITASYSTLVNTVINGTPNISQVNELAKIVAPYTRANSADLKSLSFSRNGYNLNIMQTSGGALAFDPAVTAYTLDTVNGSISVSATALASGATIAYSGTGLTINNGTITFGSTGTYTLTVEVTNVLDSNNNISVSKSYTVTIPYSSSSGNVPSKVCGYLPIGQFARPYSMGWGAIFTDDTNLYATTKHAKFTASGGGYTSTGVSLGMLGGYVQFELATPLNENANRPYGIDFMVYGNPFNGNPEAGCVMVYGKKNNVYGWYNLAGSRHYQDAQYYETLSYVRLNAAAVDLNSDFTAAGIYWSTDYVHPTNNGSVDAAIGAATWYGVPNASGSSPAGKAWWPEKASSENYQQVWKMYTSAGGATFDNHVDGVYWDTSESTATTQVITYSWIFRVPDDDEGLVSNPNATDADHTNYYLFGYADVREVGSRRGKAINPYATLPSAGVQYSADGSNNCGGDGFDLSWAIEPDGTPVALTDVTKIRVYSGVLYNTGIFGETSTEVCGLYLATPIGSSVGTTSAPTPVTMTFKKPSYPYTTNTISPTLPTTSGGTLNYISDMINAAANVSATTYEIAITASSGSNVFVNGVKLSETGTNLFTGTFAVPSATQKIQILVQSGSAAPYIVVLK